MKKIEMSEEPGRFILLISYLGCLAVGLPGIIMGMILMLSKKDKSSGQEIYKYTRSGRKHGARLVIVGSFCLVFWVWISLFGFVRSPCL